MANVAAVLKEEIRRLAKREIKAETGKTKRAVVQYRRDIANLKRMLDQQAKKIAALQKRAGAAVENTVSEPEENIRFSARSVKAQRTRLSLSAADYGKLVGVSPLTIYAWEKGETRPRKAQLAALVAVRGIGKREALQRLAEK
jgi:DNA-binding transcriptional regulator YiaG